MMNFHEENISEIVLPQFSELTSRTNSLSQSRYTTTTSNAINQQQQQNIVCSTANNSNNQKQQLLNNKYPGTILAWPDPSALMQLCEKQGIQAINIPNYSQNNTTIIGVQSNNLPVRLLPNFCLPTVSEDNNSAKQVLRLEELEETGATVESIQQSAAMAEYLQKLQATTFPITLQHFIKLQQNKKDKIDEEERQKIEQSQNSILNIPSVSAFRNQLQNGGQFINSDGSLIDLNIHMEQQPENNTNSQNTGPIKVEQEIQTDSPKPEKRIKFRAKTGEIKVTIALDGSTLYCCPECNLAYADKTDIEQHIQAHIQERKYQCKECGAMLKRKEHLDQHMRGHSDERPFKCHICQKAFKRNEHLTRHYVIHSGDKNYLCNVCQKAFSRKDHLHKHTQTHLGIRRPKSTTKKGSQQCSSKDSDTFSDKMSDVSLGVPNQELNFLVKDGLIKQESNSILLHHIQSLQKDPNLLHTFSSFKEHIKDGLAMPHQAVNMNEILPQNTRYLMPS